MARLSVISRSAFFASALFLSHAAALGAAETSFSASSEPGDSVGAGRTYFLTPETVEFHTEIVFNNGVYFRLSKHTPLGQFDDSWFLHFSAPNGARLSPGSFPNASRWPFQPFDHPGLDVTTHNGCSQSSGSFTVHQASYAPTGELLSFWASFEQHCENAPPALRGEIRFNAVAASQPVPGLTGLSLLLLSLGVAASAVAYLRRHA